MAAKKVKKTTSQKTSKVSAGSRTKARGQKKKTVRGKTKVKPEKTTRTVQTKKVKGIKKRPGKISAKPGKKKLSAVANTRKVKTVRKKMPSEKPVIEELLKKHLLQRRQGILKEAKSEITKYIKGDAKQLVETALDDGDWSVIDLSEDINFQRLGTHREMLLKIDETLRKLKEGTYGVCEDCGEKISTNRLRVMPVAIYCRDCQEKKEEFEKVTREEAL